MKIFQIANIAVTTAFLLMGMATDTQGDLPESLWVSGGPSAGTTICDRSKPCESFAIALGVLATSASGGSINALNAGNYGPFTVTESCTIDGTGTFAGVIVDSSFSGNACEINGGSPVVLRNLTFEGNGTSTGVAINFVSGNQLIIENCVINGFSQAIQVGNFSGALIISNTVISNCSTGIILGDNTGMVAQLSNVSILNMGSGILTAGATVNIMNCVITQCASVGVAGSGELGSCVVSCTDSLFTVNGTAVESGNRCHMYLSNNDFYDNETTLEVSGSGIFLSANNNRVGSSGSSTPSTSGIQLQ